MKKRLLRLLKKDGSFLLESMIGTAILAIVMTFFATVSISAFLLMKKAYFKTEVTETAFQKVEGRRYGELSFTQQSSAPVDGGQQLDMEVLDDGGSNEYVRYVAADGTTGELNSLEISGAPLALFQGDLYTFKYEERKGDYSAVFYVIKGEK